MFNRYIEKEIIPVCEQNGISQIVFSPLAQGVLTGKYKRGQKVPERSRESDPKSNMFMNDLLKEEILVKVEQLEKVATELGIPLSQLALAWVLRQPNVASALIGASRPEQVEENVKAVDVHLTEDVFEKIEQILAR
jgi:aryl-alcohol dehydrogenase-like predicted oxidoreductase